MTTEIETDVWHGCYDDSWDGFITPESFAHPAKFARGLITRIFAYMLAEGMISKGDTIVDPFGGIGTGGVVAAGMGLAWFGCELEPKFHALAEQNFALHKRTWEQFNDPLPVIVQGDSRKLRENIYGKAGSVDACVTSPPFTNQEPSHAQGNSPSDQRMKATALSGRAFAESTYGDSAGNIANLPSGEVEAVVTSPPFEGVVATGDPNWLTPGEQGKRTPSKSNQADYGQANGQLANIEGETFWTAARDIVRECHAILKPGGWAVFVCKDFIRNKQRVPFCDDWCRLLESCGFVVAKRVRAMLVKEQRHPDLFGGEDHVDKTERKSFFRRLYERKYPENSIDWEMVVFARKR